MTMTNPYFQANPDVAKAWTERQTNAVGDGWDTKSPDEFAQSHYDSYGKTEGRGSPPGLIDTAAQSTQPLPQALPQPTQALPQPAVSAPASQATLAQPQSYSSTGYSPQANAGGLIYGAEKWNVDAPQTVQSQIAKIIEANSPLMARAEARSRAQMNERGLTNTSMAIGAGQSALYDAAMPIAQQDAGTYARSGEFNASATNTASQFSAAQRQQADLANQQSANAAAEFSAGSTNRAAEVNAAALNQAEQFAVSEANRNAQFNSTQQNAMAQFNASQANVMTLQKMDESFKTAIQKATAEDAKVLQTMQNSASVNIANIQADYQSTLNVSNNATQISRDLVTKLGDIAKTGGTPEAMQQSSIYAVNLARTQLNLIGSINGVNLVTDLDGKQTDLLDFATLLAA